MKRTAFAGGRNAALVFCVFLTLIAAVSLSAAQYQVGQIVADFSLYARRGTPNLGYAPNAPMRLRDFAGKILFIEFFDPT